MKATDLKAVVQRHTGSRRHLCSAAILCVIATGWLHGQSPDREGVAKKGSDFLQEVTLVNIIPMSSGPYFHATIKTPSATDRKGTFHTLSTDPKFSKFTIYDVDDKVAFVGQVLRVVTAENSVCVYIQQLDSKAEPIFIVGLGQSLAEGLASPLTANQIRELSLLKGPPLPVDETLPQPQGADTFNRDVKPFLVLHCYACHSGQTKKGELALDKYTSDETVQKDLKVWDIIAQTVRKGEMPPKTKPQPTAEEKRTLDAAIESILSRRDRNFKLLEAGSGKSKTETITTPAQPKFDELIARALKNNPDLNLAEAKVHVAAAELVREKLPDPGVSKEFTKQRILISELRLRETEADRDRIKQQVISQIAQVLAEIDTKQAKADEAAARLNRSIRAHDMLEDLGIARLTVASAKLDLVASQTKLKYLLGDQTHLKTVVNVLDDRFMPPPSADVPPLVKTNAREQIPVVVPSSPSVPRHPEISAYFAAVESAAAKMPPAFMEKLRSWLNEPVTIKVGEKGKIATMVAELTNTKGKGLNVINVRPEDDGRLAMQYYSRTGVEGSDLEQLSWFHLGYTSEVKIPRGDALEWYEDAFCTQFVVREYGIIAHSILNQKEAPPLGALMLQDYWKLVRRPSKYSPDSPDVKKLLTALNAPVTVNLPGASAKEVIDSFVRKNLQGVEVCLGGAEGAVKTTRDFVLTEPVTFGAALKLYEEFYGRKFILRDYGIINVDAEYLERSSDPPGPVRSDRHYEISDLPIRYRDPVLLLDFWKEASPK